MCAEFKLKGPDFTDTSSGTSGLMSNFTFKNVHIDSHVIGIGASANRFMKMATRTTKIQNRLFENVTIDDKNADEGSILGNSTGTVDKGAKVVSLMLT